MRKAPELPAELKARLESLEPDQPPLPDGYVRQERHYRLITPLFGGGVEPGAADPVTIIRGTAIRGQLRFWWRATRGGCACAEAAALEDQDLLADMKRHEADIWGAASLPKQPAVSQVQIDVSIQDNGKPAQAYAVAQRPNGKADIVPNQDVPAYASFPLQPEYKTAAAKMDTKKLVFDVEFSLRLSYPSAHTDDIEAALWAWETFGGIGGRTRRGFGALRLISVDGQHVSMPKPENVKKIIEERLKAHVVAGDTWPHGVPHLNQIMAQVKVVPRPPTAARWNALNAWDDLIVALSDFRQSRSGRGTRHPGRSKWPEPDALRCFTNHASAAHSKPLSTLDKVPRAVFGLPIVFHFKDSGDPPDTILQGEQFERLASPLILRPLACAGDQAVGLALVLRTPRLPPGGLILKDAKKGAVYAQLSAEDVLLDAREAATIAPLNRNPDVLQAFLDSL